ncbi:MAG: metal ABC transporter permease [Pirellulaceae bacterium]|nr:metal ABC transporter permease [Pirellulaceae bacterium]
MFDLIYQYIADLQRSEPHLLKVYISGTLISISCSTIGCFIVLRKMVFLGDAVAHAMLAGVVASYLILSVAFGREADAAVMILGAIIAAVITVSLVGIVSKVSRIKEDTAIGILYTGIFGIGGLMASAFHQYIHIDLLHYITGTVLSTSESDLWTAAIVTSVVLSVTILFYRHLQITSFDPIMAASIGIPVVLVDYMLLTCTSLVVVSGVSTAGIIMVIGMLVTPAATAYLLFDRLSRMLFAASFFGLSSFFLGYYLADKAAVTPGPSIVVTGMVQFMVVLAIAPKYGLIANQLRRYRTIPQTLLEDILGSIFRSPDQKATIGQIQAHIPSPAAKIKNALGRLERQGLLDNHKSEYSFTESGHKEARRLLRAHRLWETYLERLGTPHDQLHEKAHHLEHFHDEATVDYLDDKLGHPIQDPHGKEIPEDFVHLQVGEVVKASLLRENWQGKIVELLETAKLDKPCAIGEVITAQKRADHGRQWVFQTNDRQILHLNHNEADSILVVVLGQLSD